jgi:hypothetical protein
VKRWLNLSDARARRTVENAKNGRFHMDFETDHRFHATQRYVGLSI